MAYRDSVLKHRNLITFDSKMELFTPAFLWPNNFIWTAVPQCTVRLYAKNVSGSVQLRNCLSERINGIISRRIPHRTRLFCFDFGFYEFLVIVEGKIGVHNCYIITWLHEKLYTWYKKYLYTLVERKLWLVF